MKNLVRLVFALVLALPASLPANEVDYSPADLDRMLAPIALYPDTVLSHILIASTYPLEVAQAARWSRQHPDLSGEQAVDAVENKNWDPSVKALVAFPEILARMDEDLEWTERLGDAFLAQEGEVMDRVQHLRQRAYDAGNLDSQQLKHVRVIREREVIYIEPALSHIVYLPYYDPWVIYGSWWWPSYPPHRWAYWAGRPVRYYGSGFYWGAGFHVAPVFYFSGFHWHNRHVVVIPHRQRHAHSYWTRSRDVVRHSDAQRWQHDSRHRRGVEYRSARLNRDYGRSAPPRDHERHDNQRRPDADARREFPSGNAERKERPRQQAPRRAAERESHQETPRSETRSAPEPQRSESRRDGPTSAESNGPRERERQAQRPQREDTRAQRPSRDEAESGRNSRHEPAPDNARSQRSERANRGEDGGRGSRQRGDER